MAKVRQTARARADLSEILLYLEERNPSAAKRLTEQFANVFKLLADHPYAGSERTLLSPGLRGFGVGRYIVFYRVERDAVSVVRVLHGARDLARIFGRNE